MKPTRHLLRTRIARPPPIVNQKAPIIKDKRRKIRDLDELRLRSWKAEV